MTMRTLRIGLTLLAISGALWASGCGGSSDKQGKPLPPQQVSELQRELDAAQSRFEHGGAGACSDIQNRSKSDVQAILASIPSSVDADVRDSLRQSFNRLWELASSQCDTAKNQPTTPQPTPQPTPPIQTETETGPTPTDTQTQPQKPKKKDNKGAGDGEGGAAAPGSD
jgi:hypothetical protein